MDGDNGDWFATADEPQQELTPLKGKAAEEKVAPTAEDAQPAAPGDEEPEGEYLDPDKLLLFKHWVRPRYLQYQYLYDYRRSYYDDVLAAIESRRHGYRRNIPKPQTWAQRILRTYNDPVYKVEAFDRFLEDVKLVTRSEVSGRIYSYLSSQTFNKRFTTKLT